MWSSGLLVFDGVEVSYDIKHYEEPSDYGIERGRISKLSLRAQGKEFVNYDRGWDIYPKGQLAKQALKEILKLYN